MKSGGRRLIIIVALLWAVICGGFAYDTVQREKLDFYRLYIEKYEKEWHTIEPLAEKPDAQIKDLRKYRKEVQELHWMLAPFLWLSFTLSGYVIAAGFLLPVRWIIRFDRLQLK